MRIRDLSINFKLPVAFGVILALLVGLGTICWLRFGGAVEGIHISASAANLNTKLLAREIDHHKFMAKVGEFFINPDITTIDVQTDHRQCNLGKWLYGPERQNAANEFPNFASSFESLEKPHQELHESVLAINVLARGKAKEDILSEASAIYHGKAQTALTATQDILNSLSEEAGELLAASETQLVSSANSGRTIIVTLTLLTLASGLVFSFLISRSISKPTNQLAEVTEKLAQGNMSVRCDLDQNDEIGQLACSANNLASSINNMCIGVNGSSSTINASSQTLDTLSSKLFELAEQMAKNSTGVAAASNQMNTNFSAIAAATEQTSTNVTMVAAAAEEMTATIQEIAASSEKARVVADEAVTESNKATTSVNELGDAAERISKVTETINEIADQTNLLALNATIEAARAGDAGKGFAVVANEIKDLAQQTTEATREIQQRIESVQSSSEQTINVINTISKIIDTTSETISTIASAVEEQTATSQEIANNVSQASIGMQEVNENIAQASVANSEITRDIGLVKDEAETVAASSSDVTELATEMNHNAQQLDALLHNFSFKQPPFDIGKIKNAHFNWKMQLTAILNGYKSMDSKDIPNHHQCEFGKWYDNAPEAITSLPIFREIGNHHELVHKNVTEAVDLYNANNRSGATRKVEDFEKARKDLFTALDQLYMIS
ncbi:methyl-accepting chemotaxis protein [Desulfopila sp. IMCC35008]|uniref:methyl-accepting chemotaxis protein n=1 Tax=Desulfopila sp. IMCC35008 TaxID=2653858 RepID=UPI0013D2342C|nr:methyl-accepting chemotaxis protein [Desulfopila sp. IMCC35008]